MGTLARQPRRFTLLDAMILVAAVAVGLVLARTWSHYAVMQATFHSGFDLPNRFWSRLVPVSYSVVEHWPVVAAATPALLLLRLGRPRPPRRRRFAPPGMAACVAATVVMSLAVAARVASTLLHASSLNRSGSPFDEIDRMNLALNALGSLSPMVVGFGVAAVWAAMAVARPGRPERNWIVRAGIVLGFLWLAHIPIRFHLEMYLPYLTW